jgi:hypothetical protein
MLVQAGGDIVARVPRTGRPRGWANSDGELVRRGLRIEGVYKLCQTYFVQFNLAELVVSLRNWRRTFRPSQEPAWEDTHAFVNIENHWEAHLQHAQREGEFWLLVYET